MAREAAVCAPNQQQAAFLGSVITEKTECQIVIKKKSLALIIYCFVLQVSLRGSVLMGSL